MARACACYSSCQNCFLTDENEPAKATSTEGSVTLIPIPAISQALTPAPVVTLGVVSNPNNELFKQFMKAYLEARTPGQIATKIDAEPRERPLKAGLPDFYYGDLHIDCYWFSQ